MTNSHHLKTTKARALSHIATLLVVVGLGYVWSIRFQAKQISFGNGTESYPVISPDGQWIAFERNLEENAGTPQIWIMSSKLGFRSARALTAPGVFSSGPSWSSDSRWISFTSSSVVVPGKSLRIVTDQLYKINIDSGQVVQLTHLSGSGIGPHPAWSRSGRIAFERDGDIYATTDDGAVVPLIKVRSAKPSLDIQFFSWAPDSNLIAFDAIDRRDALKDRSGIWIGDLSSGQIRQVSFGPMDVCPDWIDGNRVIFTRMTPGDRKGSISVLDLKTQRVTSVTKGYVDWLPRLARDGNHVIFSRVQDISTNGSDFLVGSHLFVKRLPASRIEAALFARF